MDGSMSISFHHQQCEQAGCIPVYHRQDVRMYLFLHQKSFLKCQITGLSSIWSLQYQNNGTMDEGIIKTSIHKCRLHWCFCLSWCSSFVDSESESAAKYGLQHNSTPPTPHPPPPTPTAKHCLYLPYVYCGKGGRGGGGQREGRGATVYKRG